MGMARSPVWFLGDLDDPWVASLADSMPAGSRLFDSAGDVPDDWPEAAHALNPPPLAIVLHRANLSPHDAERLARLRFGRKPGRAGGSVPAPRVILCFGPHVRHAELERWSAQGLVDAIVPDATARDTLGRHLFTVEREPATAPGPGPRPSVAVVSANFELRRTLADACESLGYPPEPASDWPEARSAGLAVWDVPVLEPDWTESLARRAAVRTVVVLFGFASRKLVVQARAHGASACLELPLDLLDLAFVLDCVIARQGDPAHSVPPPPASLRHRIDRPQVAGLGPGA
jgi:hypothetical protein